MSMSDESALMRLSLDYADAVRAADADAWSNTWAENATWHLGPGRSVEGRDAIVAMWEHAMEKYSHVVQHYLAASFDVDGGSASGRIQLLEFTVRSSGEALVQTGHYDDEYAHTENGWKFQSRSLTVYYRGPSDLSGAFHT